MNGYQISLDRIELLCTLRQMRAQRGRLWTDMMELQERKLRGGHNGEIESAIRALDNELYIIDNVIRKLWAQARRT